MKRLLFVSLLLLTLIATGCSAPAPTGIDFNVSIEDENVKIDAYYIDENGNRLGNVPYDGYLYFAGEPIGKSSTALRTGEEAAIIEWVRCSYLVDLWEFDDEFQFPVEYLEQSGMDLTKPIKIQLRVSNFRTEKEFLLRRTT